MNDSISQLIKNIVPLYNFYIGNRRTITGSNALKVMWDIGDILNRYIENHDIKPHRLYRIIYGKSEGNSNIIQRSYITREFLGRCYRIRKIFISKDNIESTFPKLQSFTLFRESMPFFDNPKYALNSQEKNKLIELLNSEENPQKILGNIRILQRRIIGISNPRTQRLYELEEEKNIFRKAYNEIYNLIDLRDFNKTEIYLQNIQKESLKNISAILGALVSEEIIIPNFIVDGNEPEPFGSLVKLLIKLFRTKSMTTRNRFRRLVPPERISRMSSMVFALTSEQAYKNHR